MHLEDIDAGDSEKSFLIRSEAVEYVSHCLSLLFLRKDLKVVVEDLQRRRRLLYKG